MKLTDYALILLGFTCLTSCDECKSKTGTDANPDYANWIIKGDRFEAQSSSLDNNVLTSACQDGHTIFIRLGTVAPTTGYHAVKVVDWNHSQLAADEIAFDFSYGTGMDYLSTGINLHDPQDIPDSTKAGVTMMSTGKLHVDFNEVMCRGYGSNGPIASDSAYSTGYLEQQ